MLLRSANLQEFQLLNHLLEGKACPWINFSANLVLTTVTNGSVRLASVSSFLIIPAALTINLHSYSTVNSKIALAMSFCIAEKIISSDMKISSLKSSLTYNLAGNWGILLVIGEKAYSY